MHGGVITQQAPPQESIVRCHRYAMEQRASRFLGFLSGVAKKNIITNGRSHTPLGSSAGTRNTARRMMMEMEVAEGYATGIQEGGGFGLESGHQQRCSFHLPISAKRKKKKKKPLAGGL